MKQSVYKSYDEIPLYLNAEILATVLGVSRASACELMYEKGFPAMRIGARLVVPKERFIAWAESNFRE